MTRRKAKNVIIGLIMAATAGFATIGAASSVELACLVKNPSSKDCVPQGVLLSVNTTAVRASVIDEFTLATMNGPALADVSRPTPKRLQLDWSLIGVADRNGRRSNVDFKMTVNLARMTFNYSGIAESSFLTPGAASGNCVAVKKKS